MWYSIISLTNDIGNSLTLDFPNAVNKLPNAVLFGANTVSSEFESLAALNKSDNSGKDNIETKVE